MKFCCDVFKYKLYEKSTNGLQIFPISDEGNKYFIQFWSAVKLESYMNFSSAIKKLKNMNEEIKMNYDICLDSRNIIKFCPWCGQSLEMVIKNQEKEFDILCDEYKHYYETIIKQ